MQDIYQSVSSLSPDDSQKIIDRLETRGKNSNFIEMREQYIHEMNLNANATILDLGCGTGLVARSLAKKSGFNGKIVGIDLSTVLIDAANTFSD